MIFIVKWIIIITTIIKIVIITIIIWIKIILRPQLVESLVIVIRAHLVKVYNNYASPLIIYKVNRHCSFLPITYFPSENMA